MTNRERLHIAVECTPRLPRPEAPQHETTERFAAVQEGRPLYKTAKARRAEDRLSGEQLDAARSAHVTTERSPVHVRRDAVTGSIAFLPTFLTVYGGFLGAALTSLWYPLLMGFFIRAVDHLVTNGRGRVGIEQAAFVALGTFVGLMLFMHALPLIGTLISVGLAGMPAVPFTFFAGMTPSVIVAGGNSLLTGFFYWLAGKTALRPSKR